MTRDEVIKIINYWRERSERPSLSGANLRQSDLSRTNLREAYLRGANLQGANLQGASLQGANLQEANLQGASLQGANLRWANLQGAKNIPLHVYRQTKVVPSRGDVIGWKKCNYEIIVKLLIPKHARRCNATTRKCRAEYAEVLEVIGGDVGISWYDNKTEYRVGEIVKCDNWNKNRWNECSGGIHFFLSKKEAEEWEP